MKLVGSVSIMPMKLSRIGGREPIYYVNGATKMESSKVVLAWLNPLVSLTFFFQGKMALLKQWCRDIDCLLVFELRDVKI